MHTKSLRLSETATLQRTGAIWEAVLITPGKGSSGTYSEEILELAATSNAFPARTKSWFKHKEWSGEQRDPRDQWGYFTEDARYEEGVGLIAPIKILPHWLEVIESLAEDGQAELSIQASAAVNADTDELISIVPDLFNSVDLVDYPGRPGSRLSQKIERARSAYRPTAESSAGEKENHMDKEILDAITALTESLKPVVASVTESKTAEENAAQAKVDTDAIETATASAIAAYEESATAIRAAKLLPSQTAALLIEARKGTDMTDAIAKAAKFAEEAIKHAAELGKPDHDDDNTSYIMESTSGSSSTEDFTVSALGGFA